MSQFKELLQADFEVAAQNAFKKSSLSFTTTQTLQ